MVTKVFIFCLFSSWILWLISNCVDSFHCLYFLVVRSSYTAVASLIGWSQWVGFSLVWYFSTHRNDVGERCMKPSTQRWLNEQCHLKIGSECQYALPPLPLKLVCTKKTRVGAFTTTQNKRKKKDLKMRKIMLLSWDRIIQYS